MSYDLYFRKRHPAMELSPAEFLKFFRGRRHYTVDDTQARYFNDATGVYFSFEHVPDSGEEWTVDGVDIDSSTLLPYTFGINYLRPHTFALEAEPELSALIAHFDLLVEDPQIGGMGTGEYCGDRFLAGWNRGNTFALGAVGHSQYFAFPAAELERHWRWNLRRESLQRHFTTSAVVVPRIFYILHDNTVRSAVLWPDAVAAALPIVDMLVIRREELAPRRLLRKQPDTVLVPWSEAFPVLERFCYARNEYYLLDYNPRPGDIETFVRTHRASTQTVDVVPHDRIIGSTPATAKGRQ